MLSRTADHLFWLARYTERAENTARMLDVNMHASLRPQPAGSMELLWRGVLGISELQDRFDEQYGSLTPENVIRFLTMDTSNRSSICRCLFAARENARAVRGVLTTEAWETINATWIELRAHLRDRLAERDPLRFAEWVKHRSHLLRGVMIGTMLKDEGWYFARLGTFLERADNTARILDVRFHGEQDPAGVVDGDQRADFYHWAAVLRSVSAFEVYRRVYSDVITPERVAELLILRPDMPRSLLHCVNEVVANLAQVRHQRSGETERRAGALQADLYYGRIEDLLRAGLHAYLDRFLARINDVGDRISTDFLVPLSAA